MFQRTSFQLFPEYMNPVQLFYEKIVYHMMSFAGGFVCGLKRRLDLATGRVA